MLMQAKNAVGSNTPGAASSAADLETQEAPKSSPKPEKIDVEKQWISDIDFSRVLTSFWKGFWKVFGTKNACEKRFEEKCPTSKKYCKN